MTEKDLDEMEVMLAQAMLATSNPCGKKYCATIEGCKQVMPKLFAYMRLLMREADWLSHKCATLDGGIADLSADEYRELARKVVAEKCNK